MKLKKVIKNSVKGKSVVKKYSENDFSKPVQEVVYSMHPFQAIIYYYEQFVLGNFAFQKYPRYIEGIIFSNKIKDVYYYDKLDGYLIKSMPYTNGDRPVYRGQIKKSILPKRKSEVEE